MPNLCSGANSESGILFIYFNGIGIIHPCFTSFSSISFRTCKYVFADLRFPLAMNSLFFCFLSESSIGVKGYVEPLVSMVTRGIQFVWCTNKNSRWETGRNSDP